MSECNLWSNAFSVTQHQASFISLSSGSDKSGRAAITCIAQDDDDDDEA